MEGEGVGSLIKAAGAAALALAAPPVIEERGLATQESGPLALPPAGVLHDRTLAKGATFLTDFAKGFAPGLQHLLSEPPDDSKALQTVEEKGEPPPFFDADGFTKEEADAAAAANVDNAYGLLMHLYGRAVSAAEFLQNPQQAMIDVSADVLRKLVKKLTGATYAAWDYGGMMVGVVAALCAPYLQSGTVTHTAAQLGASHVVNTALPGMGQYIAPNLVQVLQLIFAAAEGAAVVSGAPMHWRTALNLAKRSLTARNSAIASTLWSVLFHCWSMEGELRKKYVEFTEPGNGLWKAGIRVNHVVKNVVADQWRHVAMTCIVHHPHFTISNLYTIADGVARAVATLAESGGE